MHFWIFSYNRGIFLRNCVESIERCAPMCAITIFDDNSTDEETVAIIRTLGLKHRVLKPVMDELGGKHGGLYGNMQAALDRIEGDDLYCFVQDDMQLVRQVDPTEIENIARFFVQNPSCALISPTFLKGCTARTDRSITRYDADKGMYYVDRMHRSAGAFYSDVFIAHAPRLRAASWQFCGREKLNEQQARQKFSQLPCLKNPFLAFLPNVSAYRGKTQTWAMRRAEAINRSGFFPIKYMTEQQVWDFCSRDPAVLPYAEDFLELRSGAVPKPWIYYPLQDRRWLKKLNSLQVRLARMRRPH